MANMTKPTEEKCINTLLIIYLPLSHRLKRILTFADACIFHFFKVNSDKASADIRWYDSFTFTVASWYSAGMGDAAIS